MRRKESVIHPFCALPVRGGIKRSLDNSKQEFRSFFTSSGIHLERGAIFFIVKRSIESEEMQLGTIRYYSNYATRRRATPVPSSSSFFKTAYYY